MNYNIIPRYPNSIYNLHNPDSVRSEKSIYNLLTKKNGFNNRYRSKYLFNLFLWFLS